MTRPCQVVARKFTNKLHYSFPAQLLEDDGDLVRVYFPIGTLITHHTRGFTFVEQYNTEAWFWRSRWFNVFVNCNADGSLWGLYCNVATPITLTEAHSSTNGNAAPTLEVGWIDLDLDVRFRPDGSYQLLDEDEFDLHRVAYGYPDEVQNAARRAVDEITALAQQREGPFRRFP